MSLLTALLFWLQIVLGLTPACQPGNNTASATAQAAACAAPAAGKASNYVTPPQINNGF